jgi:hypothetical protein
MSAVDLRTAPKLRQLPPSARAAAEKVAGPERVARDRFSRTFAAVLAERYGGRWTVRWTGEDGPMNREGFDD